ncbi:MAG TPA: DNA-3-methyladenine glycosylase I [Acidobacteriota bacterium]|nr:DNA-3-methyladenine glycosylase I [Acidobacteriota bacterium]HNR39675.1 DNA-3-methyladenine glycosylase I [Acidobacteriota bacterium]HNT99768.1 DNA-3-methyladenine glycosylase I [Acidobacteriota bacterium]HPB27507.1 DNA-3-methyladenine glycosylase I [Acidobacteriota bacterium]
MNDKPRCAWCLGDPLYLAYHDQEWGVPLHDDRGLFEFLVLETFQAGLSWLTILKKRDNFHRAFAGFDPQRVVRFDERDRRRLLADAGIVRNRLKVDAAIANARVFLEVQAAHGSFDRWIWSFTDGRPVVNRWRELREVPAQTPLAATISREMRRLGFRFAGPVVVYSHMQATGMVNDHLVSCYRHAEIRRLAAATTI